MYALIARGGIDGEGMGLATALLDGLKPGRSAGQITVCDRTGTGVQDTAVGNPRRTRRRRLDEAPARAAVRTEERF